jgi:DNA-binding CsgD family transcriptional regulator
MYAAKANHEVFEPPASAPALRDVRGRVEPLTREVSSEASVATATSLAILDALPASAFIVDGAGRVLLANARGRSELDEGMLDLAHALEGHASSASLTVHPLPAGADGGARTLVLRSDPPDAVATRVTRVAALWKLTRHQANVLALLAHGEANKTIAATRGCAVRTVEVHVTSILKKSGTVSRAELIARFWTLG